MNGIEPPQWATSIHWDGRPDDESIYGEKFRSLDFVEVTDVLSLLHIHHVRCTMINRYDIRRECMYLQALFEDGTLWTIRLEMPTKPTPNLRLMLENELYILQELRQLGGIPVPEVVANGFDSFNQFNSPYIVMNTPSGRTIDCRNDFWNTFKAKIIDQMAYIMIQLTRTTFHYIGGFNMAGEPAPFSIFHSVHGLFVGFDPQEEYYMSYMRRFAGLKQGYLENQVNRYYQQSLTYLLNNTLPGPFPLTLPDFGTRHMVINEEGDIVAILDWRYAHTAPWEVFAQYPFPLDLAWHEDDFIPNKEFHEIMADRRLFVDALRKYEAQSLLPTIISAIMPTNAPIVAHAILTLAYDTAKTIRWASFIRGLIREFWVDWDYWHAELQPPEAPAQIQLIVPDVMPIDPPNGEQGEISAN